MLAHCAEEEEGKEEEEEEEADSASAPLGAVRKGTIQPGVAAISLNISLSKWGGESECPSPLLPPQHTAFSPRPVPSLHLLPPCPYSSLLACLEAAASARMTQHTQSPHLAQQPPIVCSAPGPALESKLPASQASPNHPHVKGISTELRGFLIFSRFFVMLANRGRGQERHGTPVVGTRVDKVAGGSGIEQKTAIISVRDSAAPLQLRLIVHGLMHAYRCPMQTDVRCSLARASDAHACAHVREARAHA